MPNTTGLPRSGRSMRGATVALAGIAIVLSGLFSPVAAASPRSALVLHRAATPRGAGSQVVKTAIHVDGRAAARAAAALPRPTKTRTRLRVDLGARNATAATASTADPSGARVQRIGSGPRIAGPTLVQQVTTRFPGITQAGTCDCEPPDPWIAVNASYVVQSTNGMVRISNRAGSSLVSMPTWALFAVPSDRTDSDPRILWDAVHGRWVGVITTYNDDATVNGLRLAVSDGADPTAGWSVYPIETGIYLADYPGISSSTDKIVLSSDDFDGLSFAGPTIYVIDWSNILAATPIYVGAEFFNASQAHFRPAQMLSATATVPVVYEAGGVPDAHPGYFEVIGTAHTGSVANIHDLSDEFGSVPFTLATTQPEQPGAVSIAQAVDERPTDAVYRSGHLWFTATGDGIDVDGVTHWTTARYTQVLTSANNTAITALPDMITVADTHWFMPGVGISGNGTAFLVATRTNATEFPTTAVATVLPVGTLQGFVDIEASTEAYTGVNGRWGDFVGVAADPSGSGAVWVEHELVGAGGGWRTSVARIVSDASSPGTPGTLTQTQVIPTTLGSTVPVTVAWGAAADPGSGVSAYLVERSDDGGGFFGVLTPAPSVTQPLLVGHRFQYRISAVDAVGNVGTPRYGVTFRPTLYQSTSSTTVSGTWRRSSSSSYSGGSTRFASAAGASATFTATLARSISIVSSKAATRGSFKVYIDGVYKGTISTYSTTTKFRQLVYQFAWPTAGTHKVKIVVSGTAHHPRVDLDAFVVLR